jgi:DNA-binding IclR family transcriptional regulator
MSTRPDDQLVNAISQWLARHLRDGELRARIEEIGVDGLTPDKREAVQELLAELERGNRGGHLERVARETLEALALG